MQQNQTSRSSTENGKALDLAAAWPAPASDACLEDVEPGVPEREIKFAVPNLVAIEERLKRSRGRKRTSWE